MEKKEEEKERERRHLRTMFTFLHLYYVRKGGMTPPPPFTDAVCQLKFWGEGKRGCATSYDPNVRTDGAVVVSPNGLTHASYPISRRFSRSR